MNAVGGLMQHAAIRCGALSLGLCAGVATAQEQIEVRGVSSCSGCRIVRESIVLLRDDQRGLIGGLSPVVAQDSRGRYLVSDLQRSTIAVFDSAGNFLRVIGRRGRGPGEFRLIDRILVTPGDTLRVYDLVLRRESVLSPEYQYIRSRQLPLPIGAVALLPGQTLLMNSIARTRQHAGLPLHLIDAEGKVTRSFGTEQALFRSGFERALLRSLAVSGTGQVYVVRSQEYVIELWESATGRKVREWSRRVPWFRPWLASAPMIERRPPRPVIVDGLHHSAEDHLWVAIQVADPNYRQAIITGGPHGLKIANYSQYYDTIIEVFDPRHHSVIASQRFDEVSGAMFGRDFTFSTREDPEPAIQIWRLRLVRP
jgi:hypothetical protein